MTTNDSVAISKIVLGFITTGLFVLATALFGAYQLQLNTLKEQVKDYPVLNNRVAALEKGMEDVHKSNETLNAHLQKLVRNQIRMCSKEDIECEP